MTSINEKILRRIRAKKRGWVFTPKDFVDLAPRSTVDVTLYRLVKREIIRKLSRGLYDFPIMHPTLGTLSPDTSRVKSAIARKSGETFRPSGAQAVNQLGLDTQVPAKNVSLTSGKTKKMVVANNPIELKHSKFVGTQQLPPNVTNTIIALKHLGKKHVSLSLIKKLNKVLSKSDAKVLRKNISKLPDWMIPIILKITE